MSYRAPLNINTSVVENKESYNPSSKLTYNFVTDPRLRRGHNFGVVYVTSSSYDGSLPETEKEKKSKKKKI